MATKSDPISPTEDPTLTALCTRSAAQAHADLEPVRIKQAELEPLRLAARAAMRIKAEWLAEHGAALRPMRQAVASLTPDPDLAVERARTRLRGNLALLDGHLVNIDQVPHYEAAIARLTPADLAEPFLPKAWANASPRYRQATLSAAELPAAWAALHADWQALTAALAAAAAPVVLQPVPLRDLPEPGRPAQRHAISSTTPNPEAA